MKLKNLELAENHGEIFVKYMADMIGYERKRIGGNFVVAQAVPTRNLRDVIRKSLGKDLIFIILSLKKETTLERLTKRQGDSEAGKRIVDFCIKLESFYELKFPDEDQTYDITITSEMNENDVLEKILEIVDKK